MCVRNQDSTVKNRPGCAKPIVTLKPFRGNVSRVRAEYLLTHLRSPRVYRGDDERSGQHVSDRFVKGDPVL